MNHRSLRAVRLFVTGIIAAGAALAPAEAAERLSIIDVHTEATTIFPGLLPPPLARKVAYQNAMRIYKLAPDDSQCIGAEGRLAQNGRNSDIKADTESGRPGG